MSEGPEKLPIAAGQIIPFWPEGEGPTKPCYRIRVPDVLQVEDYEVEKARAGVRFLDYVDLCDLMEKEVTARGAIPEMLQVIDGARAWFKEKAAGDLEPDAAMPVDIQPLFAELERKVIDVSGDYRAALRERGSALVKVGFTAFRQFVVGWENVDVPFDADLDGRMTKETLAAHVALSKGRVVEVGLRANVLALPGADTRKNSPSPSRSTPSPAPSTATARRTAARAGKSTAKSTKKTPRAA